MVKIMIKNVELLKMYNERKYDKLFEALQKNVVEETIKEAGKKTSYASIYKRIITSAKKNYNNNLKKQHNFIFNNIEYFGITEGHYIIASNEKIAGIEEAEKHELYNFKPFFECSENYKNNIEIDLENVKFFYKNFKADKKPYIIKIDEEKYAAFNPQFLIDCLEICDSKKIYYSDFCNVLKSPAIIESNNNNLSLLLPVNLPDAKKDYNMQVEKINDLKNKIA